MVVGFELRALNLIGRHFTTSAMPPALFTLVIFLIRSHFYAQTSLDLDPPIYAFHIPGMTGKCHHIQLFMG
jgi:hypothetical protein